MDDEYKQTIEDAVDAWDRVNSVASKFYLQHLHEAGSEWDDFVEKMSALANYTSY